MYRALRHLARALRYYLAPFIGRTPTYEIAPGYRHRDHTSYFDDTQLTVLWQREVYESAQALMREHRLATVLDVGCGSGFKLVHILGEFETTGVDLAPTIEHVRRHYPDRNWVDGSFENIELPKADLVICADVLEHVADPDALMHFIVRHTRHWVVLSTPDRDLLYPRQAGAWFGPPDNPAHVREWRMGEFSCYVGRFLEIDRHEISNREQATQMIIGHIR